MTLVGQMDRNVHIKYTCLYPIQRENQQKNQQHLYRRSYYTFRGDEIAR